MIGQALWLCVRTALNQRTQFAHKVIKNERINRKGESRVVWIKDQGT